ERVEREAALVRHELCKRRSAGDVSDPATSRRQTPGRVRNGRVRHAEEDDIGIVARDRDPALAQAGADGGADAAGADDMDSLDHVRAPAPIRMPGTASLPRPPDPS